MKSSTLTACFCAVVLQLCLISFVDALHCYQCDSSEDIRCSEELISRDLRSLPCDTLSEPRYCVKMTGIFGAESLRCYQCSAEDDNTCGDPFDPRISTANLTECNLASKDQYCIKTTGVFAGNLGAKRFCSERFLDNYCTYVRRPGDQREYRSCVYTCTGDGCNGSSGLSPSSKWIQMAFAALVAGSFMTRQRI